MNTENAVTVPPAESPAESPHTAMTTASVTAARCKNCGAALWGRYCVDCSQAADVHVPTTAELVHEAMEGLAHADSRLWRTLIPLWFQPGRLTNEFIAGRRIAYVPPFRLYLVLSVIFFLLWSLQGIKSDAVVFDPSGELKGGAEQCQYLGSVVWTGWRDRITHACTAASKDNGASLLGVALATTPKAMFIFLPVIAFLHMLLYWRPRHRYVEHLLFFLHLHAMFFSVAIVLLALISIGETWPALEATANVVVNLLVWASAIYSLLAMRRVFGRSWAGTFFKAFLMMIVYFVVLGIGVAGIFVYAALQL
jgi:hypothetical protein